LSAAGIVLLYLSAGVRRPENHKAIELARKAVVSMVLESQCEQTVSAALFLECEWLAPAWVCGVGFAEITSKLHLNVWRRPFVPYSADLPRSEIGASDVLYFADLH